MTKITIAKGDGIGPEIMNATLNILQAAGAQLEFDEIAIGEKVYLSGNPSGISAEDWATIRRNKIFLKGPITTPQGGGYKSLNVSTRKFLGLFANQLLSLLVHTNDFFQTFSPVFLRKLWRRRFRFLGFDFAGRVLFFVNQHKWFLPIWL